MDKITKAVWKQRISVVAGVVILIALILAFVVDRYDRAAQKELVNLYDTSVLDYEAYSSGLNNLVTIYSIWDEATYQSAMKNAKIGGTLRERVFPTEHYRGGNYNTKPSVSITDMQYELEATPDNTRCYYVTLKITNNDNNRIRYYAVLATLKDDMLVDYEVI